MHRLTGRILTQASGNDETTLSTSNYNVVVGAGELVDANLAGMKVSESIKVAVGNARKNKTLNKSQEA